MFAVAFNAAGDDNLPSANTAVSASVTVPEGQVAEHDWAHSDGKVLDVYDNILTGGNYYLNKDIALKSGLKVRGEVKLCLNGYALTREGGGSVITVENGGHLILCDCGEHKQQRVYAKTDNSHYAPYTAVPEGEIQAVLSGSQKAVSFECGVITGGNAENGGGVYVSGGGKLTMLSGAVAGNKAAASSNRYSATNCGGGIYLAGGAEAVISGGVIVGNFAGEAETYDAIAGRVGGGIMAEPDSKLAVEGNVLIQGNAAVRGGGGISAGWNGKIVRESEYESYAQKIFNTNKAFTLSGNARVIDNSCGEIADAGNKYVSGGGNLLLVSLAIIYGGEIADGDIAIGQSFYAAPVWTQAVIEGGRFDANFRYIRYTQYNNSVFTGIRAIGGYFSEEAKNTFDKLLWHRNTDVTMAKTDEYDPVGAELIAQGYTYGIYDSSHVVNGRHCSRGTLPAEYEEYSSVTLESGSYFLSENTQTKVAYVIPAGANVYVDMNGKNLSSESSDTRGVFAVDGGTLTIAGKTDEGYLSCGTASHCVNVLSGKFILQSGRLNLENGASTTDRAVSVDADGEFEMNGGRIVRYAEAQGYAVETQGVFRMTGGEIAASDPSAVAVHAAGGSASITGGSAGNISVNISCTLDMSDGTAGNITLYNGAQFNMSGGTAGNIVVSAGTANITGGYMNAASSSGGTLNITGGYMNAASSSGGTLNITGGYFATSPAAAAGYQAREIDADFDKNFIEGYNYGVYADENIHEDRLAVPITSDTVLDGSASFYYLSEDIYSAALRVTGNAELCLNGHVLQGDNSDSVIVVENGASLTLCNCVEGGSGNITGGNSDLEGGGIRVLGGTLIIKGGKITGNSAELGGDGIYVRGGTLEISGGTIENDVLAVNSQVSITGGYFSSDVSEYVADGFVCVSTDELTGESDKGAFGVYKSGVTDGYFSVSVNGMHEYTGQPLEVGVSGSNENAPVQVSVKSAYSGAVPVIQFFKDKDCTLPAEAADVKDAGVYYMLVSLVSYYDSAANIYYPAESSEPVMVRINPKTLTVTGAYAVDRYYDGTAEVRLNGNVVLNGVIAGEENSVSAVLGVGALADKNAGTNKAVTVNITLTGEGAHNYSVIQPEDITANIYPAELTVEGFTAQGKTYDGTTAISVAAGNVYGVVEGDDVTVTAAGVAADANAGSGKSVTITYALSGADAGNYAAPASSASSADISKADPEYTLPEGVSAEAGTTLADITLPEGWAWADNTLSVSEEGGTFEAIFTPADSANYNTITAQITVTAQDGGLTGGEIAGIVVGSTAGAAAIGVAIFFIVKKKRA